MIGLVEFGHVTQAMADRFTYFSGIGILVMVAWSIPVSAWKQPLIANAVVGATIASLVWFTIVQTRYWHDSLALFGHNVEVEDSAFAELNFGGALFERAELLQADHADIAHRLHLRAITHLQEAVNLNPHKANAQASLATALARIGQIDDAIRHATAATQCEPGNPKWHLELAQLLYADKQYDQAASECRAAISLGQESAAAHRLLGKALYKSGNTKKGIDEINQAATIESNSKISKNIRK
jgi:tetratricopeptide (TPR) repeat protein